MTSLLSNTAEKPVTVHLLGNLLTFRARSDDTNGQFTIVDALTAPGGGAPPHMQGDVEAFLVLDGTFEFLVGQTTRRCGPGGFVYVPTGTAHAYSNVGDTVARMLIINLPGGMHEGFFGEAGDAVEPETRDFPPAAPPDIARLQAASARHGIVLLPAAA